MGARVLASPRMAVLTIGLLGLAAAGPAGIVARPALAQSADLAALEQALGALYGLEPPGDVAEVAARLEGLKQRRPNDARVDAGLAMAYAALGERRSDAELIEKAVASGDRAVRVNPESRTTRRAQGVAALAAGGAAKRKRERQEAFAKAAKAFAGARKADTPELWLDELNRARALIEMRALDDASSALEAAEKAVPAEAVAERPERRALALERARIAALRGALAAARADLARAGPLGASPVAVELAILAPPAEGAPADPDPLPPAVVALRLGGALLAAGRSGEANDAADRALALDPQSAAAKDLKKKAEAAREDALAERAAAAATAAETGPAVRPLPDALKPLGERLAAPEPFVRADAAQELMADPIGLEHVLRHLDREVDPFVTGEIAARLGARAERDAAAALRRAFARLPRSEVVARTRILRALGSIGDPSVLPEMLKASVEGESGGGHDAVVALMGQLDDVSRIKFQRALVESKNEVERALAPILAEHLVEDVVAQHEARETLEKKMLRAARLGVLLVLGLLGAFRWRMYKQAKHVAEVVEATKRYHKGGH